VIGRELAPTLANCRLIAASMTGLERAHASGRAASVAVVDLVHVDRLLVARGSAIG